MSSLWPTGTTEHNPNISPPSALPKPTAAKSIVPEVSLRDVNRSSLSTCSPSGSQVDSAAVSTTAEGTPKNSATDGSEFACEMELISVAEVRAEQQAAARETMLNLMTALQGALRTQKDLEAGRAEDHQRLKDLQACLRKKDEQFGELGKMEERLQIAMDHTVELEQQLQVLNAQAEEAKHIERFRRKKKAAAPAAHATSSEASAAVASVAMATSAITSVHMTTAPPTGASAAVASGATATSTSAITAAPMTAAPPMGASAAVASVATATSTSAITAAPMTAATPMEASAVVGSAATATSAITSAPVTTASPTAASVRSHTPSAAVATAFTTRKADPMPAAPAMRTPANNSGAMMENTAMQALLNVRKLAISCVKETPGMMDKQDRLILRCIMTSWDNYVQTSKYYNTESVSIQTELGGLDLDMQERDLNKLEDKLREMQEQIPMYEQNLKEVQEERDGLLQQISESKEDYEIRLQHLHDELTQSRAQAAQKDVLIEQLRQQSRSHENALRQAEAAWDSERRNLQATIRDVSSQLGSAIAQARHMEMMVQRAKRNCSDLFQDQIAQMVADLEAAKHRLSQVGKERDKALEKHAGLQRRLGQRTRQIELERQFLPLIHHAQGPLGIRKKGIASQSDSCLPTVAAQTREKFRMTQGGGFANTVSVLE